MRFDHGACLGVILLAGAGLSGCTASPPAPTPSPPAAEIPAGVSVAIKQYRLDYAPRALEISVTNDSVGPVTVTRARFDSPLFDGGTEWERATLIPAGSTRDLRVLLGDPVCDAASAAGSTSGSPVDAPRVILDFELPDGAAGVVAQESADRFDTVAKVTAQDCIAERAAAVAELAADGPLRVELRDGRPVALIDLTATPTGAEGSFSVAGVGRTTLVRPAGLADTWPLGWTVSSASGALASTLAIWPSNCNPHIVAEDKRGTYLPLDVTLDDGTAGTVFVGVTDTVREQVYEYVADYCEW